jgi:hypothetical protein
MEWNNRKVASWRRLSLLEGTLEKPFRCGILLGGTTDNGQVVVIEPL